MSVKGRSFAGAFALAKQVDVDTPNTTPDIYLPITSEGIRKARPRIERSGIYSSPEVQCHQPGLELNNGSFSMEADGIGAGYLMQGFFKAPSSASQAGTIAAAPVPTAGTSGDLADGDYQYKVANIFKHSETNDVRIAAASAANSAETLSGGGNGNISIAWTNAAAPTGWTLFGAMIYRKIDSGSFVHIKTLTGTPFNTTSWNDTGAETAGTAVPPEQATVHTFTPPVAIANLDLPYFTVLKMLDLASAVQIAGFKFNTFALQVPENGDEACTMEIAGLGRGSTKVSNGTPAYTPICSMLSHQSRIIMDGEQLVVAKAMSLQVNNNLSSVYSKNGSPFARDHNEGRRQITGSLTLGAEGFEQWDRLDDGTEFELMNEIIGPPTTENASVRIDANTVARPFPYGMTFHLPKCLYDGEIGGALEDGNLMNETPNFGARFSPTDGYSIQVTVTNRTASYS